MSTAKVDPGAGYRLLGIGEVKPEGYEVLRNTEWFQGDRVGEVIRECSTPCRVKLPEDSTTTESVESPKHDTHYRTLETKGQEPIERMEALVCRGIPEEMHRIAKRNLNMAMASKHQDRAGEKSGEAWEKELQKAENYLHRAWSGRWIG